MLTEEEIVEETEAVITQIEESELNELFKLYEGLQDMQNQFTQGGNYVKVK